MKKGSYFSNHICLLNKKNNGGQFNKYAYKTGEKVEIGKEYKITMKCDLGPKKEEVNEEIKQMVAGDNAIYPQTIGHKNYVKTTYLSEKEKNDIIKDLEEKLINKFIGYVSKKENKEIFAVIKTNSKFITYEDGDIVEFIYSVVPLLSENIKEQWNIGGYEDVYLQGWSIKEISDGGAEK